MFTSPPQNISCKSSRALFSSLLNLWKLSQCLAYSRYSLNICWMNALEQWSAYFFYKEPDNKYFRFVGDEVSTLPIYFESSHGWYVSKKAWLFSNKTLFTKIDSGMDLSYWLEFANLLTRGWQLQGKTQWLTMTLGTVALSMDSETEHGYSFVLWCIVEGVITL